MRMDFANDLGGQLSLHEDGPISHLEGEESLLCAID